MMRLFEFLKTVKTDNRVNLFARSGMMTGAVTLDAIPSKLELEAGILSYIPVYAPWKKSIREQIVTLFGNDVKNLVSETYKLRCDFSGASGVSASELRGYSFPAKELYIFQTYVDLVCLLNSETGNVLVDNNTYTITDGRVDVNGEIFALVDFHQWLMETVKWKLDLLAYANSNVYQAMSEVLNQYKAQKGYVFDVDLSAPAPEASEDRSPVSP
jgi:hypothetical protein